MSSLKVSAEATASTKDRTERRAKARMSAIEVPAEENYLVVVDKGSRRGTGAYQESETVAN